MAAVTCVRYGLYSSHGLHGVSFVIKLEHATHRMNDRSTRIHTCNRCNYCMNLSVEFTDCAARDRGLPWASEISCWQNNKTYIHTKAVHTPFTINDQIEINLATRCCFSTTNLKVITHDGYVSVWEVSGLSAAGLPASWTSPRASVILTSPAIGSLPSSSPSFMSLTAGSTIAGWLAIGSLPASSATTEYLAVGSLPASSAITGCPDAGSSAADSVIAGSATASSTAAGLVEADASDAGWPGPPVPPAIANCAK